MQAAAWGQLRMPLLGQVSGVACPGNWRLGRAPSQEGRLIARCGGGGRSLARRYRGAVGGDAGGEYVSLVKRRAGGAELVTPRPRVHIDPFLGVLGFSPAVLGVAARWRRWPGERLLGARGAACDGVGVWERAGGGVDAGGVAFRNGSAGGVWIRCAGVLLTVGAMMEWGVFGMGMANRLSRENGPGWGGGGMGSRFGCSLQWIAGEGDGECPRVGDVAAGASEDGGFGERIADVPECGGAAGCVGGRRGLGGGFSRRVEPVGGGGRGFGGGRGVRDG